MTMKRLQVSRFRAAFRTQSEPAARSRQGTPLPVHVVNAIGGGVNGSNGTFRMPGFERNGFQQPKTTVLDLRLSKRFNIADRVKLEFLGEAFNIVNHQNVTGVNTTAFTVGSVSATKTNTLTYTTSVPTFGGTTFTNTSGFSNAPRQIQLGIRAQF